MKDLAIRLANRPGALAEMGEALGKADVSVEGGGGFVVDGQAIVHFLFENGAAARRALEAAGIDVLDERDVVVQRLDQQVPGQLGSIGRAMADAGVNIEVVYSDHDNRLILGVDKFALAKVVSDSWPQHPANMKSKREHRYATSVRWTGNRGTGTSSYRAYARDHVIEGDGKSAIDGSADAHFRGDRTRWNPEELLVASLAACHQLAYLHLCADAGVVVTGYEDHAKGTMIEHADGGAAFASVVLHPAVRVDAGSDRALALSLHEKAHALCFIARSVRFPVTCEPTVMVDESAVRDRP
ncbi:MAG: OsmC family protein [Rhodanobacteraceae bacterium]